MTAATTTVLKPVLGQHRFSQLSRRSFGRLGGDILRYLDLQASAWGNKEFAVNFASIGLFPPRDHIVLPTGGRLPQGKSPDGWWSYRSHEIADRSMTEVASRFEQELIPWFERTSDLQGFIAELETGTEGTNPHPHFEIACCEARLGNEAAANQRLLRASELYKAAYDEMSERTWCLENLALVDQLRAALGNGTADSLLTGWREYSYDHLRLKKVADAI